MLIDHLTHQNSYTLICLNFPFKTSVLYLQLIQYLPKTMFNITSRLVVVLIQANENHRNNVDWIFSSNHFDF